MDETTPEPNRLRRYGLKQRRSAGHYHDQQYEQ
jgi:hypothetical protein